MVTFKMCINLRNNSKNLAQFKKIVVSLHRETARRWATLQQRTYSLHSVCTTLAPKIREYDEYWTITFANGKLHFECETEGVNYHSSVSHSFTGNDVPLSSTYTIQVYASKDGYKDSDVATKDINVAGLKGDVNSDGEITAQDASLILQYVAGKTSW